MGHIIKFVVIFLVKDSKHKNARKIIEKPVTKTVKMPAAIKIAGWEIKNKNIKIMLCVNTLLIPCKKSVVIVSLN